MDRGITVSPQQAGRAPHIERGPLTVRAVQVSDFDEIIQLGAEIHAESAYASLPYDVAKLRSTMTWARRTSTFMGWVAHIDGELVGAMAGCIDKYFFCNLLYARDAFMFVKKDHRKTATIVLRLIKAFEQWAKTKPIQEIRLGSSTGYKPKKMQRFYTALGYDWVGTSHTKRMP